MITTRLVEDGYRVFAADFRFDKVNDPTDQNTGNPAKNFDHGWGSPILEKLIRTIHAQCMAQMRRRGHICLRSLTAGRRARLRSCGLIRPSRWASGLLSAPRMTTRVLRTGLVSSLFALAGLFGCTTTVESEDELQSAETSAALASDDSDDGLPPTARPAVLSSGVAIARASGQQFASVDLDGDESEEILYRDGPNLIISDAARGKTTSYRIACTAVQCGPWYPVLGEANPVLSIKDTDGRSGKEILLNNGPDLIVVDHARRQKRTYTMRQGWAVANKGIVQMDSTKGAEIIVLSGPYLSIVRDRSRAVVDRFIGHGNWEIPSNGIKKIDGISGVDVAVVYGRGGVGPFFAAVASARAETRFKYFDKEPDRALPGSVLPFMGAGTRPMIAIAVQDDTEILLADPIGDTLMRLGGHGMGRIDFRSFIRRADGGYDLRVYSIDQRADYRIDPANGTYRRLPN